MFIQTEQTPNPLTLKFLPGEPVMAEGVREFRNVDEAEGVSSLAVALFEIEGVTRVFYGSDFISVTRADERLEWRQLKAPILAAIMDHYTSGQPLLRDGAGPAASQGEPTVYDADAEQVVQEIKDLLDTRVRPAVARDGGDILFDRFEPGSGTVYLHMRGACSGCPSSSATLKSGVENLLKHYIPEVVRVEQTL